MNSQTTSINLTSIILYVLIAGVILLVGVLYLYMNVSLYGKATCAVESFVNANVNVNGNVVILTSLHFPSVTWRAYEDAYSIHKLLRFDESSFELTNKVVIVSPFAMPFLRTSTIPFLRSKNPVWMNAQTRNADMVSFLLFTKDPDLRFDQIASWSGKPLRVGFTCASARMAFLGLTASYIDHHRISMPTVQSRTTEEMYTFVELSNMKTDKVVYVDVDVVAYMKYRDSDDSLVEIYPSWVPPSFTLQEYERFTSVRRAYVFKDASFHFEPIQVRVSTNSNTSKTKIVTINAITFLLYMYYSKRADASVQGLVRFITRDLDDSVVPVEWFTVNEDVDKGVANTTFSLQKDQITSIKSEMVPFSNPNAIFTMIRIRYDDDLDKNGDKHVNLLNGIKPRMYDTVSIKGDPKLSDQIFYIYIEQDETNPPTRHVKEITALNAIMVPYIVAPITVDEHGNKVSQIPLSPHLQKKGIFRVGAVVYIEEIQRLATLMEVATGKVWIDQGVKVENIRAAKLNDICYGDQRIKFRKECLQSGHEWDKPCVHDTECPFFHASSKQGGCRRGFCELPVGALRTGFRHYRYQGNKPLCEGCKRPTDPFDVYTCCDSQSRARYVFEKVDP